MHLLYDNNVHSMKGTSFVLGHHHFLCPSPQVPRGPSFYTLDRVVRFRDSVYADAASACSGFANKFKNSAETFSFVLRIVTRHNLASLFGSSRPRIPLDYYHQQSQSSDLVWIRPNERHVHFSLFRHVQNTSHHDLESVSRV